jgi:hypothetical protein
MMIGRNAIRAFEPAAPIEIYRVAGRRPSNVWVDASGALAEPGPACQQLKELVYWHTRTRPGDQVQERLGGMFVVTPDGSCHPIALCPPAPIDSATAFQHAQVMREADAARIEELVASGALIPVAGRKPDGPPSRPADRLVPADHALVIDTPPPELERAAAAPRRTAGLRRF